MLVYSVSTFISWCSFNRGGIFWGTWSAPYLREWQWKLYSKVKYEKFVDCAKFFSSIFIFMLLCVSFLCFLICSAFPDDLIFLCILSIGLTLLVSAWSCQSHVFECLVIAFFITKPRPSSCTVSLLGKRASPFHALRCVSSGSARRWLFSAPIARAIACASRH